MHLLARHNADLSSQLEHSTVFSGLSSDIQNDLISSITAVMKDNIRKELDETSYVALILDETLDVNHRSQLAVILRYVNLSGNICERFIEFTDVSADRSANGLSQFVINFLKLKNIERKLICQSYDGAAVMSGNSKGLQTKIRASYPSAIFIHCFAHKLNLVLLQSCSRIKDCKSFFSQLSSIISFFNHSSKRSFAFDQVVKRKLPSTCQTRWEFNGRIVLMLSKHLCDLRTLFNTILEEGCDKWDAETITTSAGYLTLIDGDGVFLTLLHFFSKIFPEIDILFNILQKKTNDISYCIKEIENFIKFLDNKKNEFGTFWCEANNSENIEQKIRNKRTRTESCNNPEKYIKNLISDILDKIKNDLEFRFQNLKHIQFIELLDTSKFDLYTKKFPDETLEILQNNYSQFFDISVLKIELCVIYRNNHFKEKQNISQLLNFLTNSDLVSHFSELFKLCNLILTIPVTTAGAERSFSSMKRIKSFLRNRMNQGRLSDLALMTIESELLIKLKSSGNFYEQVISEFSKNERRIDLNYKQ